MSNTVLNNSHIELHLRIFMKIITSPVQFTIKFQQQVLNVIDYIFIWS